MPIPACCYCGTRIPNTNYRRKANAEQLARSVKYRTATGLTQRDDATHICGGCNSHPPQFTPQQQVRNRSYNSDVVPQVPMECREMSQCIHSLYDRFLDVDLVAFFFLRNLNFPQPTPTRRPLLDISNTAPLNLGSPIKRSRSDPLPAAAGDIPSFSTHPLSPLARAAIITLAADQQPIPLIAAKLDTTSKTVKKWVDRMEDTQSLEDDQRSGRPDKLTEAEKVNIVVIARIERFVTPKKIRSMLSLHGVSNRTIRRVLDEAGVYGRIARVSPPLKDIHLKKRLSFANGYRKWRYKQWKRILWSDEASALCGTYGQVWVQREANIEWHPDNVVHREKHPDKVHMWGCFSGYGIGKLFLFEENLDAPLMLRILKENLLKTALPMFQEGEKKGQWYFQQDNDPKHTSRIVQTWIRESGIDCLDWPPYSPDLNPIENLWADVKRRAEQDNPQNVEELKTALMKAWKETDPQLIKSLIKSMRKRCKQVIDKEGWHTGY